MKLSFRKTSPRRSIPADLTIIESMVVPAFVLDRDRKVVVWNKALESLTGVAAADVVGTSDHWKGFYDHQRPCLADLLYGGTEGQSLYAVQGTAGTSHARAAENWCSMPRRPEKRYLIIDASAILDEAGQIAAVVETLRDTTSEQDAKAELLKQHEEQERNLAAQLAAASRDMGTALKALAKGQLTHRIATPLPGPIDELRGIFNSAVGQLEAAVQMTIATAATVYEGSEEIATSAEDLSHRTEQQAANLEQTAAALAQIMETVKRTAGGASHARSVVATAREDVARSGRIVQDAVEAMGKVEKSSKEIGQIVGVIDEIAFQTNLLALNAGVEAARAGEVGRGFAVVAAEVRALAQRSAESAKEIRALMVNSTTHVEQGVTLVGQAGQALTRIVTQIVDIDGVVAGFAQSSQDQATSLTEINTAVAQMDTVTQQNAGLVQSATAVGQNLRDEAAELERTLGRFEVGRDAHLSAPARENLSIRHKAVRDAPPRALSAGRGAANAARPVPALKTTGSGGAAAKPQPAADGWDEF